MSKAINDIDDPRLVKALAHPLRVRILGLLEHRTLSPKQLAEELGLPVENVSYHVRTLRRLGFIKLVRKKDGPVVGVHMIGARVGELIGEGQLIVNWEAYPEDVAGLVHAHPTQNEALGEAFLALAGKPLHAHA